MSTTGGGHGLPEPSRRGPLSRIAPPLSLLAVLLAAAWYQVPSHWIAMAMDPEFSGWVAPISNRFADGMVLYTDGAHSPLPPLAFVLLYALGRGHAIWLTESATNAALQAATILLIYGALTRAIGRRLAWMSALGLLPIFLAIPKSLAYDALVQCLVAGFGWAMLAWALAPTRRHLIVPALLGGTMVLAKHNTAIGALAGAAVVIFLCARELSLAERARAVLLLAGGVVAIAGLELVMLSSFLDVGGFVHDVLVTGSEPKGGTAQLRANFATTRHEILTLAPWCLLAGLGLVALGMRSARSVRSWLVGATAVGAAFGLVLALRDPGPFVFLTIPYSRLFGLLPLVVLECGLMAALLGVAMATRRNAAPAVVGLGILSAVWFPAAVTHSLSVDHFRWTYDNNPLIAVTIAWPLLAAAHTPVAVFASLAALLQVAVWSTLAPTFEHWRSCTVAWPEIPALAGARLPARAESLRAAVRQVQESAPRATDRVLLLPNDPDLESMFGRPRPILSSAILFVDQYWDQYVDADFDRLRADPPAVIVFGPAFNRRRQRWWRGENLRTDRLLARVEDELLPQKYRLVGEYPLIRFGGDPDALQIYARR